VKEVDVEYGRWKAMRRVEATMRDGMSHGGRMTIDDRDQVERDEKLRGLEQQMLVMKSVQVEHDSRLSRIWHDVDALRQRFDAFAAKVEK
jgi:hypothetical protein